MDYSVQMQRRYKNLVEAEIRKQTNLGWVDLPPNEIGLRVSNKVNEFEISFPSEIFDAFKDNQISLGVWTKYRARLISIVLEQHDQELIWEIVS